MEGDERQEKHCEGYSRSGLSDHADLVLLSGLLDQGPVAAIFSGDSLGDSVSRETAAAA